MINEKNLAKWNVEKLFPRKKKDVNILGIASTGHGAALAFLSSTHGIRAMTLDRFTGTKHSMLFSRQELQDILSQKSDTDTLIYNSLKFAYGSFPPAYIFEDIFIPFLKALLKGLPVRPKDIDLVVGSQSHFAINRGRLGNELNGYFRNAEIFVDMEHHEAHQCQAFLACPFEEAAVLTIDQSGEDLERLDGRRIAMTLCEGSGSSIRVISEHCHPESSPGLIYDTVSQHIGFRSGQEGKTMGLAPYGTDRIYKDLVKHLTLYEDGSFRFLTNQEFYDSLATFAKMRKPEEKLEPVHADIAYAGQAILEDVMQNAVDALGRLTSSALENLCIAGGVALNSVANEKVFRSSRFKRMYIMPNANDDGQALGCALYGARVLRNLSGIRGVEHDYLGPPYRDVEIEEELRRSGLQWHVMEGGMEGGDDSIAAMIARGLIVGWFKGGSEFGPRALGHRSILADPRYEWMKDHLNESVKHREPFRPFAPVVLEDKASEWFEVDSPSRFMLRVVPVLPEKRSRVPAITHVDGTARIQTVSAVENPELYRLIEDFETLTGVPVLLNTSFNVAGRPIVETPSDAIECFLTTDIDVLVLENFVVKKPNLSVKYPSMGSSAF